MRMLIIELQLHWRSSFVISRWNVSFLDRSVGPDRLGVTMRLVRLI